MHFSLVLVTLVSSLVAAAPHPYPHPRPSYPASNGKTCTVTALGKSQDDTPQILAAFSECNNGGNVVFPEGQNYTIATKLNPILQDVTIDWKGVWTMSDNLAYWRNNSYPIAFQNHHAGIVFSGSRIYINGYGSGGINGQGNAWYNAEQKVTQPGRPMPFVWWNVSDVYVEHFFVKDPPLWSLNIMNGTSMWFDDVLCNATAINAPYGTNWVQNTDGFDTMDAHNIMLTNFVYQGGDDCIAVKPRSYNIYAQNITCNGGNGIAIGSLGQYLEDSSVENVHVKDAQILTHNNDMEDGAYIKTWVGDLVPQTSYESNYLPRGGGWGVVRNILFENFVIHGAGIAAAITQDSGDNGTFKGTSKMQITNVAFVNFTGYTENGSGNRTASVSCSNVFPCYNIAFQGWGVGYGGSASTFNGTVTNPTANATGTCGYITPGGVTGLNGKGC